MRIAILIYMNAVKRMLDIRTAAEKECFLLGPRQTGKSTLLRDLFPESPYYNLFFTDVFFRLQQEWPDCAMRFLR